MMIYIDLQRRVWNPDWRVPSRLLRKRPVVFDEPEDQCSSLCSDNILDCQYEWLVKWCGLDYVHATWELENSNFLQSPQGQKLIREYEIRYEKAHRVVDKVRLIKQQNLNFSFYTSYA